MLDVTFQGGCILPADDPLWNQSAHCQGAYGHGFRSYVLEWRIYRYAGLPSLFIIVVTNKKDYRDRCPQDVQANQPKTKKSVANTETQCPRSQSGHESVPSERKRCQHRCCRGYLALLEVIGSALATSTFHELFLAHRVVPRFHVNSRYICVDPKGVMTHLEPAEDESKASGQV